MQVDKAQERAEKQSTYSSGDAEKTDITTRKRIDIISRSRTDIVSWGNCAKLVVRAICWVNFHRWLMFCTYILKPTDPTFLEYAMNTFANKINNTASTHKRTDHKWCTQMILMCWRSLLSFSMTVLVQNQWWMQLDAHYSLRRNRLYDATTPTYAALFSMYFILHARPETFGDNHLLHMQQCQIQTNWVGKNDQMGHCLYIEQIIIQSLTFSKQWRNVEARMNEMGDVHAPNNHVLNYELYMWMWTLI